MVLSVMTRTIQVHRVSVIGPQRTQPRSVVLTQPEVYLINSMANVDCPPASPDWSGLTRFYSMVLYMVDLEFV